MDPCAKFGTTGAFKVKCHCIHWDTTLGFYEAPNSTTMSTAKLLIGDESKTTK